MGESGDLGRGKMKTESEREEKRGKEKETENRNKNEQYYAPVCDSLSTSRNKSWTISHLGTELGG